MIQQQVLVVGGGVAGISCAIWLKQLGVTVRLIELSSELGGLQRFSPYVNRWIPGVMGLTGQEVAACYAQHIKQIGVLVNMNCFVQCISQNDSGFHVVTNNGSFEAKFIVLATGANPRKGDFIPSANTAIGPGLPMESINVENKRVAIFGGGDNAFDQAQFVKARGAREVTIFARRKPRAQPFLQQAVSDTSVVVGDVVIDQVAMTVNGTPFDVFGVMYGFEANIPSGLALNCEDGYVQVDRLGQTNISNIYACGELTNFMHPCVATASAHGAHVAKQLAEKIHRDGEK
jgi:thioredoxin reductase